MRAWITRRKFPCAVGKISESRGPAPVRVSDRIRSSTIICWRNVTSLSGDRIFETESLLLFLPRRENIPAMSMHQNYVFCYLYRLTTSTSRDHVDIRYYIVNQRHSFYVHKKFYVISYINRVYVFMEKKVCQFTFKQMLHGPNGILQCSKLFRKS